MAARMSRISVRGVPSPPDGAGAAVSVFDFCGRVRILFAMSPPATTAAPGAPSWMDSWPLGVRISVVGLAYFVLARLGLEFAVIAANISPVWPPSGLALGALIVGGRRLWPGVAVGALAAAISAGASPLAAALMATGNTLEPLVTVSLLRWLFEFRDDFTRPQDVVGFMLVLGLAGAPLSALIGTGALVLAGTVPREQFVAAGLTWWAGNFTGGLVIGPLLIAAHQMFGRVRAGAQLREFVGLLVLLVAAGGTVFVWGLPWGPLPPALAFLPFPLLVWIAWRFGIGGAAVSLLTLSTLALCGTTHGTGPFAPVEGNSNYGHLLAYLVVVALTSLALAAFNAQREQVVVRLRQREWQLSEAQRIGNLGVWVWDLRTDKFQLSNGGLDILGERRAAFVPTLDAFLQRVHTADRAGLEAMLGRARAAEKPESCDLRMLRPDGTIRQVTTSGAALRNARGQPILLLGTMVDVSERKRFEDEQANLQRKLLETQKLESLGLLAGGIAHDFNNLLTGIMGNASLLRLKLPEDAPMHEGLRRIEASAERAADLCRQMLAYSGKGRFVIRAIDLNELVRGTLALARTSVPKKAELTFAPATELPRIRADLLQLRQVLLNLLVNAAESLPETGGRVAVRIGTMAVDRLWLAGAYLAPDLPEGEYVFIEVEDSGCGIAPEQHAKVFDPFFSTKFTGRGLGLAAVAGIVRAHRGAVRFSSEVGRGTTFRVVFPPTAEAASPAPAVPASAEPVPAPAAGPAAGLVLVVDDEEAVRQVAAEVLGKAGHEILLAHDGLQALELFTPATRTYRAVLLDVSMPRLDGLETYKRIREMKSEVPVVLMSGYDQEAALERFAGLGIRAFLQKPFTPAELRAIVAKVVAG